MDIFSKKLVTIIALLLVNCYDIFSRGKKLLRETTFKMSHIWDFAGGPVVKILRFHGREHRVDPGQGTKIAHAMWCGQKKEERKYKMSHIPSPVYCQEAQPALTQTLILRKLSHIC